MTKKRKLNYLSTNLSQLVKMKNLTGKEFVPAGVVHQLKVVLHLEENNKRRNDLPNRKTC